MGGERGAVLGRAVGERAQAARGVRRDGAAAAVRHARCAPTARSPGPTTSPPSRRTSSATRTWGRSGARRWSWASTPGSWTTALGLELTCYDKRTEDAILLREIAPSQGFPGRQYFNAGEISNRGVELLLRGTALRRGNVELELTLQPVHQPNKVVDLGLEGLDTVQAGTFVRHVEGYPVGAWWEKRIVDAQFDPATGRLIAGSEMCDDGQRRTGGVRARRRSCSWAGPRRRARARSCPRSPCSGGCGWRGWWTSSRGYHKLDGNLRVRCVLFCRCRENWYPREYLDDPAWLAQTQRGGAFVNGLIQRRQLYPPARALGHLHPAGRAGRGGSARRGPA